jgi:hypothetical protein
LEIFEVLPDMMTDDKIVIEDEIRAQFVAFALEKLQPQILNLLSEASVAFQKSNSTKRRQVINCFQAWMLEQTNEGVKADIPKAHMLSLCFKELQEEGENNEEAADAIIACMVICKDALQYPLLYENIINGLFAGRAKFESFVERGLEEEVKSFVSVYSVLVSRVFGQILQNPLNETIRFMLEGVFLRVFQQKKREIVVKAVS